MRRFQLVLIALLTIPGAGIPAQTAWHPAEGSLSTRWTRLVSLANAHPEYPRPQMVRPDWLNLNGLWDYAITEKDAFAPSTYQGKILVPFPVESALSGVMKPVEPNQRLWYRRRFEPPKRFTGKRILLHFGAVDWETTVIVNGREMPVHRGGYDPFTFDITPALSHTGLQEIIVSVWDPTDSGQQPHGKQVLKPGGIMYTATTGIWQTVWLEPVPDLSIDSLEITPDVDHKALRLTVRVRGMHGETGRRFGRDDLVLLPVQVTDKGRVIAGTTAEAGRESRIAIPTPKLWSPDSPYLYGLNVKLVAGGKPVDSVSSYFGMRKIALAKDKSGITRPMLNGKFVFEVGPLDQGFWPDGLYAAPTDDALKFDIQIAKKLGFNMARKHVKVEPDRWYYWCDKLGYLVWQDMPAGGNGTAEAKREYESELRRMVDDLHNHPSIIQWVVFNEGWGQYDTERITAWVKRLDPSRLVDNASGWTDRRVGDVNDMHNYPGPGSPKPEPTRAAVLGEFGGLGLSVDGHTWEKKIWGYQGMASRSALTRRYVDLLRRAYALKSDPGLCAAIYTQITDVETEGNGLLTYDRAVVKLDMAQASAANRGLFPPAPVMLPIVPTSQKQPITWRYTTTSPPDGWQAPGFDDSGWSEGPGGFGTAGTPGSVVRTTWKTDDIWIRREFTLTGPLPRAPELLLHHDEDAEVYVNGVLTSKVGGFVTAYEPVEMSPESRAALRSGKNVLAIHCHQTTGGQYIDAGIIAPK